jgi:hypothetical protein
MAEVKCDSFREAVAKYLANSTTAERIRDLCVVTLPIPTVDGRMVDVFVENKVGDYYLVHDAGKAANELILNGVDITPTIRDSCDNLARAFGVAWVDEVFQFGCKMPSLATTALAVATCSAFASVHLLAKKKSPRRSGGRACRFQSTPTA